MSSKIRVKQSKGSSIFMIIFGIIFISFSIYLSLEFPPALIGVAFGIFIVSVSVYNLFSKKGSTQWEIDVDSNTFSKDSLDFETKLRKLNSLKQDRLSFFEVLLLFIELSHSFVKYGIIYLCNNWDIEVAYIILVAERSERYR